MVKSDKSCSPDCCSRAQKGFCLLQYCEILSGAKLKYDQIETHLECFLLQWHGTEGVRGKLLSALEFDLVPIEAIRKAVRTIRRNQATYLIDKNLPSAANIFHFCEGAEPWENEIFYVNRFSVDRSVEIIVHFDEADEK